MYGMHWKSSSHAGSPIVHYLPICLSANIDPEDHLKTESNPNISRKNAHLLCNLSTNEIVRPEHVLLGDIRFAEQIAEYEIERQTEDRNLVSGRIIYKTHNRRKQRRKALLLV